MLPDFPRRAARDVSLSVRLSNETVNQLKTLASRHNLSQADIIECLLDAECKREAARRVRKTVDVVQKRKSV